MDAHHYHHLPDQLTSLPPVAAIVVGLVLLFLGRKLFWLFVGAMGFELRFRPIDSSYRTAAFAAFDVQFPPKRFLKVRPIFVKTESSSFFFE
jgi:hypothetical protein